METWNLRGKKVAKNDLDEAQVGILLLISPLLPRERLQNGYRQLSDGMVLYYKLRTILQLLVNKVKNI